MDFSKILNHFYAFNVFFHVSNAQVNKLVKNVKILKIDQDHLIVNVQKGTIKIFKTKIFVKIVHMYAKLVNSLILVHNVSKDIKDL